jgi:hypothetical protein
MRKACAMLFFLSILTTTSFGSDWLVGGYVGSPNYAEIRPYFTDPIFSIRVPVSQAAKYNTADGSTSFYREPIYLGKYAARFSNTATGSTDNISIYPETAWQSEFRNKSLAMMEWDTFEKNWTSTMNYASSRSSLRVQEDGGWKSI